MSTSFCFCLFSLQIVMRYHGHQHQVRLLLPLGDQLISSDAGGDVIVWDVQEGGEWGLMYCELVADIACWGTHHALACLSRRVPSAAFWPQHIRCISHDAPKHVPEQGAAGKFPGSTAAVEHQDQVCLTFPLATGDAWI